MERTYVLIAPLAYTGRASSFTYHCEASLMPGQIVRIPLGRRESTGIVLKQVEKPDFKTRPIHAIVEAPPLPAYLQELAAWVSEYYGASSSSVWSTFLPAGVHKERRPVKARATAITTGGLPVAPLTGEQAAALASIRSSPLTGTLVQGVTGSGKTRLYLELAAEALAQNRSVIILVPEITLTPQLVEQFELSFGDRVISTHSKLTEAQRHRIWDEAAAATAAGEARIVVGPRSSLFLPLARLGLIVVDECHETSYKQDQHPRYQAITVAARLTQLADARLILGSATPGLGELFLAEAGRLNHVHLTQRANTIAHTEAQVIDLRQKELLKTSKFIAQPLVDAITQTLEEGRQSLLYLNRRGSASSHLCGDCGYVSTCPHCLLPLTFHADLMRLICHHCNYRATTPAVCPQCNGANLRLLGGGTKRIEAEVERLWPEARIARLDRDSATITHIKQVFRALQKRELDIVIGTQMIAKGLDLPAIDTVGIISADTMLHLPDYTAAERTYQLLSQVSGRAGRGDRPGQIFIQTYTPDHPAIVAAARGDFNGFSREELEQRRLLRYPPYTYLLKLTVASFRRDQAVKEAETFATQLRTHGLSVVGPAPAFIETQGSSYHWIITVKSPQRSALVNIATHLPGDHWTADLDPASLL